MSVIPPTPQEQKATDALAKQEANIRNAWAALSEDPNFLTVFNLDLQTQFSPFQPSFQGADGFNPHAAAMREGSRQVINYIYSKILKNTDKD